ncbi:F-box family protein [Striga asiatica]|uniref:F-box family protein n=1 Tax=Striga asiatica TaxID=4170 RepID=A0A5A7P9G0_STRAF|nr:F-box family protein [Striga asiatica]
MYTSLNSPQTHELKKVRKCSYCDAARFQYEPPTFCCDNGKVKLAPIDVPDELYELFTSDFEEPNEFHKSIRQLNSIFSFTSFGVKLDKDLASARREVYTFRAQGMVYHDLPGLIPNERSPGYFQLYFVETENYVDNRMRIFENSSLSESMVKKVMDILDINPYAKIFRSLKDIPSVDDIHLHIAKDVKLYQRVYNSPTVDQVAAICVERNNNDVPFERDIIVHTHSGYGHRIKHYFGCYDPLQYPLLFPMVDSWWHQNIKKILPDSFQLQKGIYPTAQVTDHFVQQMRLFLQSNKIWESPKRDSILVRSRMIKHVIYGAPLGGWVLQQDVKATLDCLVISTKNNSFKVLQDDDDDDVHFPNLSRLKAENYSPMLMNANYEVRATCDSWMLLTCTKRPDYTWDLLWDPTTDEIKALPYFSLASPRLTDIWAYGFGFDPSGGGYKKAKIYVELLSLASGSWREIAYPHSPYDKPMQRPSLHINGVYYWSASPTGIISFDFAKEEFTPAIIPMPKRGKLILSGNVLAEVDGSLAVIIFNHGEKPFNFELWVWKDQEWSKLSSGDVPAAAHAHSVRGLYNKRKLLLWSSCGDLLLYDIDSTEYKPLGIHAESLGLNVIPYVANADSKLKSSMINLSSGASNVCLLKWTRNYFVLSMENNMFKVVQDEKSLPNLSLLKVEQNYDPLCLYAKYHVLASCYTWMLWMCTQNPGSPLELLWDPRTDVLVTLPFFEAVPRVPCPIITSMYCHGIGFVSGEYKVVRCRVFKHFRCENEAHAELFSLETCSWKQIPFPHDPQLEAMQHPSLHIHINGFYYWLAVDPTKTEEDLCVISFDFANEEFPRDLMRMPESKIVPNLNLDCVSLAEFHGLLAVTVSDCHGQKKQSTEQEKKRKNPSEASPFIFEIWVWSDGIWSHKSTYEVTPPHSHAGVVYTRVVGLYKDYDKAFLLDSQGYLWLYDLVKRELEPTAICDDSFCLAVYPYV